MQKQRHQANESEERLCCLRVCSKSFSKTAFEYNNTVPPFAVFKGRALCRLSAHSYAASLRDTEVLHDFKGHE